ncbi:MAG: Flp pilus assembly protein CpaB [Hyphomicrobiaceae bacterium]
MLLGAAACAAAAALLAKSWLVATPVQQPVVARQDTAPVTPTAAVVLAAIPLKFGMTLSADMLIEVAWPGGVVPPGSFASKGALIGVGGDRVVLAAIAKNEPILATKVSGPGQRPALSLMIEDGKTAVTIRVDDVLGVAGFVQPDDRVDVLLTRADRTGGKAGGSAFTDLLLQNTRVLAIDQLADRNTQAKPVKAVTLEVDTESAQKLVLAASVGQLSLALRRSGSARVGESRRIGLEDLPSSPRQPDTTVQEEQDRGPTVTVIRGVTERKQYDVSLEAKRSMLELLAADEKVKAAEARSAERGKTEEAGAAPQPR